MANFVIFHLFYGWVGGGAHLGKVPLILVCDQQNLLGPSRSLKINSQGLEDTQVGYISQKYTLEKYTLAQKSLVMVATSLVRVSTSLAEQNEIRSQLVAKSRIQLF